jgi:hypothetical protein
MDSEAIVQEIVSKIATRWERMSPHRQKRYKRKHPNSEKRVMRELIPEDQTHKKVKHQKHHRLHHMKRRNKINYDATFL